MKTGVDFTNIRLQMLQHVEISIFFPGQLLGLYAVFVRFICARKTNFYDNYESYHKNRPVTIFTDISRHAVIKMLNAAECLLS